MSRFKLIAQVILGSIFFIFGLNGFFRFIPVPPMPDAATAFIGAIINTGYLMSLVKTIEVFAGVLLLLGIWVPLALVLLAPIVINIFLIHLFLAPSGLPMALLCSILELFLIFCYRDHFRPLLKMRS